MAEPEDAELRRLLEADPAAMAAIPGARVVKENPVRTVWRVPRDGRPALYLKRFRVSLFPGAIKYLFAPSRARAEWEASRDLRAAGVPAAEVAGFSERRVNGFLRGASCAVVEFPDAMELVPWMFRRWGQGGPWSEAQRAEREALLRRLAGLLRALHDAGYAHPDLHGGNLLVAREGEPPEIRIIDLHTVRRSADPRRRWRDLWTLLHSLLTATDAAERRFLAEAYDGATPVLRRFPDFVLETVLLARENSRVRSRTSRAKLFGRTGRLDVARRGDLRMVFLRAWGPGPFLAALEAHASAKEALKRGGRSTVTRVVVPGPGGPARLVVKETKVRGVLDLLKNALREPRAVQGWIGANGLWHRHLDVAEPRALVTRGRWPLRRESFLVMEDVAEGGERFDLRALRLWGQGPLDREGRLSKRATLVRFGALVGDLHARGVYHGDFKAVNVFVRSKHGRESFCLVDTDRVSFDPVAVGFRRRVKNLAQLAASVGTFVSRSDRLRFYRAYADRFPGAWEERKDVAREVAAACARKIVVTREPIE